MIQVKLFISRRGQMINWGKGAGSAISKYTLGRPRCSRLHCESRTIRFYDQEILKGRLLRQLAAMTSEHDD